MSPLSLVLNFSGSLKLCIPTCCISTAEPCISEEGHFVNLGSFECHFQLAYNLNHIFCQVLYVLIFFLLSTKSMLLFMSDESECIKLLFVLNIFFGLISKY